MCVRDAAHGGCSACLMGKLSLPPGRRAGHPPYVPEKWRGTLAARTCDPASEPVAILLHAARALPSRKRKARICGPLRGGGRYRDRTSDLLLVRQALSQLS
jgi:hypothetical protein